MSIKNIDLVSTRHGPDISKTQQNTVGSRQNRRGRLVVVLVLVVVMLLMLRCARPESTMTAGLTRCIVVRFFVLIRAISQKSHKII
jgi:hypothetical protein